MHFEVPWAEPAVAPERGSMFGGGGTVRFWLSIVGAMVVAVAGAAPKSAAPKWDSDLLGTWRGVEAEALGVRGEFDSVWEVREGVIVGALPRIGDPPAEWRYTVDPSADPRGIDLFPDSGPAKGTTLKGVYVIEKGRLKVCYVSPRAKDPDKQPRPASVEKASPDLVILTFERKKR